MKILAIEGCFYLRATTAGARRQFFAGGGETPASRCDRRPFRRAPGSARAINPASAPADDFRRKVQRLHDQVAQRDLEDAVRASPSGFPPICQVAPMALKRIVRGPQARLAGGQQLPGEVEQQVQLEVEPHEIRGVRGFVVGLSRAGRVLRAHRRPAARAGCARRSAAAVHVGQRLRGCGRQRTGSRSS